MEVLDHSIGVCLSAKLLQRTVSLYVPLSFLIVGIGLFNFSHSDGCEIVYAIIVLISLFLMTNDVKLLLTC